MSELRRDRGTYLLIFNAIQDFQCHVGKLGRIHGPAGFYGYVGSARGPGGVAARVNHHLKITDKPHWHLDYARPYLRPLELWCNYSALTLEHQWAQTLMHLSGKPLPMPGFGASDCRCESHLVYFEKVPALNRFKKLLQRYATSETLPRQHVVIERIRMNAVDC
ncbi:MAG: GIY-YIG nuclease family protein [Gammaproteobacteria bacterium]|jgi:Uri superfamily endonuclease